MLPSAKRLKRKKDFEMIFKNGRNFKGPFLVLKIVDNKREDNRFGFVVSQKISKKATIRNQVRRRLASGVKEMKNITPGNDFLFLALPGIEKKEFIEVKDAISQLVKKAGFK